MGFRIIQLQYDQTTKENKVIDGFEMWLSNSPLRRNAFGYDGYAEICSSYTPGEKRIVTTIHGYHVEEKRDNFKKITFCISDTTKVEEEDEILLMLSGSEANRIDAVYSSKIAGRFDNEGIFVLRPNEKIVLQTYAGVIEEYVAIQFEKKMYLIKLHNN